jgi:hypothetical protein
MGSEFVTRPVANAAGKGIFPASLVGSLNVEIANSLIVGCHDQGSGLVPHHHEAVIAAAGSAGNHPAVEIIVQQGGRHIVHGLRVSQGP